MVKLPDKKSIEGLTKKVGEAVKLPSDEDKGVEPLPENKEGLTEEELEKIREDERKRLEKEKNDGDMAEKARKYEAIEAEKKAEEERLLAEKKKEQELARLEAERQAEEAKKDKERDEWAREEERKKAEEEKKRKEIEKEILKKQKEEGRKAGHTGRNILIVVVLIVAVLAAGYISLISGNDHLEAYGYPLSYSAQYDVRLPDNTNLDFAGVPVTAISSGDSAILMIDNVRRTMALGESATYPAKHITISMFGMALFDSDYQITATYRGVVTNKDDFLIIAKTSAPVPSWMVGIFKPGSVDITPV
ncbi:hypothetical protein [Methanoplanus endosymbiosus]|uniref:Uncharacterized protein n=1 Tax=Methanoplanus endosymbiosus TaxID=33865 RepID=A0A9E7PNS8_9EURY|nr:hypothetical protein [Methanoplanus endosymbiosus]UUX93638.1 hypothetical protein L6E24_05845 [Methanoplanus endosymbiosus]